MKSSKQLSTKEIGSTELNPVSIDSSPCLSIKPMDLKNNGYSGFIRIDKRLVGISYGCTRPIAALEYDSVCALAKPPLYSEFAIPILTLINRRRLLIPSQGYTGIFNLTVVYFFLFGLSKIV